MLSCLALGLAAGVGIYWVATFSTLFILCVVWVLESLEPKTRKDFVLKIGTKDTPEVRANVEDVLKQEQGALRAARGLARGPHVRGEAAVVEEDRRHHARPCSRWRRQRPARGRVVGQKNKDKA